MILSKAELRPLVNLSTCQPINLSTWPLLSNTRRQVLNGKTTNGSTLADCRCGWQRVNDWRSWLLVTFFYRRGWKPRWALLVSFCNVAESDRIGPYSRMLHGMFPGISISAFWISVIAWHSLFIASPFAHSSLFLHSSFPDSGVHEYFMSGRRVKNVSWKVEM